MKDIEEIHFFKKTQTEIDFETMELQSLFSRRNTLPTRLENAHRVQFYHIVLVTEGEGLHYIDFQPYRYSAGSVIFVSKGQIHAFDPRFSSEGIIVVFTEKFLVKNVIHSDVLFLHRLFNYHLHTPVIHHDEQKVENLTAVIKAIHAEYNSQESFAKEEVLRCQLKILLLKTERIKRSLIAKIPNPGWIDLFSRFKSLVEKNCAETRNAQDYAGWLNVSSKHLNKTCRAATGKTAKQFIDSCLILEIKRQLSLSTLAVKELTYLFGFDEPTNFLKYFKKHTGETPVKFRSAMAS